MFPRFNVLGIGVHAVCFRQASTFLLNAASEKQKGYVCAAGVPEIMRAQEDPALRTILNNSILTMADNCAVASVGRMTGYPCMTPIDTPQLVQQLCRLSIPHGFKHFFLGAAEGVAEKVGAKLREKCTNLLVAGTYSISTDSLTDRDEAALLSQLRAFQPDFIWVGLESPGQEQLIARCRANLDRGIILGVGQSTFEVLSGERSLGSDNPAVASRQLWKSLIAYSRFVIFIAAQFLGLKRYSLPGSSSPVQPSYSLPRAA